MTKQKRFLNAFNHILHAEAAGGIFMIMFAIAALLIANSHMDLWYKAFISTPMTFGYGDGLTTVPLKVFVKDVLMVVFFFSVGMELKRDMSKELATSKKQILLPVFAALGGMIVPAVIYYVINMDSPENLNGWAIPTATDIAFAVAVLLMVGSKLPRAAKTFLLAVAIFDDLGAIIIIALFYSGSMSVVPMIWVGLGVLGLYFLNRANIPDKTPYILIGIALAFALHAAGIHTTIAGVLTGVFLPMRHPRNEARSPLGEAMKIVHPWVSFFILPLFAFVSAGVSLKGISMDNLMMPVTLGVFAGLFFGKQIGVFFATYVLVKSKYLSLPEGTSFSCIYGVSIIAGIGFTMSLFVNMLAFSNPEIQSQATLGILVASLLATVWGGLYLTLFTSKKKS